MQLTLNLRDIDGTEAAFILQYEGEGRPFHYILSLTLLRVYPKMIYLRPSPSAELQFLWEKKERMLYGGSIQGFREKAVEYFDNKIGIDLGSDAVIVAPRNRYTTITVLGKYKYEKEQFFVDWLLPRFPETVVEKTVIKALLLTSSVPEVVIRGDSSKVVKDSTEVLKDAIAQLILLGEVVIGDLWI